MLSQLQASGTGHHSEGAIAVVVVEHIYTGFLNRRLVLDEDIHQTIVIVVDEDAALPIVATYLEAGDVARISKGAVAISMIHRVTRRGA